ncbi:hypothetical protein GCM10027168_61950 [Streptomyces capparidis]
MGGFIFEETGPSGLVLAVGIWFLALVPSGVVGLVADTLHVTVTLPAVNVAVVPVAREAEKYAPAGLTVVGAAIALAVLTAPAAPAPARARPAAPVTATPAFRTRPVVAPRDERERLMLMHSLSRCSDY